jgi:hypothetical protein
MTNKELAIELRRFADGHNVHSDVYFGGRNHERATFNDRDAMQRIIYGRALPGDADRVRALADDIEAD